MRTLAPAASIGDESVTRLLPVPVGPEEGRPVEALRCLHSHELRARQGVHNNAVLHLLDGVLHGDTGYGGLGAGFKCAEHAAGESGRKEGSGRIVDKHEPGFFRYGQKSVKNGVLTAFTARGAADGEAQRLCRAEFPDHFFALSEPVRRKDKDDAGEAWYQTERACREPEEGNTLCSEKLLGHARGLHEARALASGEEDRPWGVRERVICGIRHRILCGAKARLPLKKSPAAGKGREPDEKAGAGL